MSATITADLIRGHIDTIILHLLSKKDMYGYQISREIFIKSDNVYELKEASLYSSVKRLEKDELITAYWGDESKGGRRKYYQITNKGLNQLQTNLSNWNLTKKIIDLILKES